MLKPATTPPQSEEQLMTRALSLAGFSLGQLAHMADVKIPMDFKREKGWTGQLIELYLGASAGSKPIQDFPELGVELKTIPIDSHGKPLETTYVCMVPALNNLGQTWLNSSVRNKLQRVLWLPVQGDRNLPPADRHIGSAILWSPDDEENQQLQHDWEEHMEKISLGNIEQITAHQGEVLQIRPKAANASIKTQGVGADGQTIKTLPRGFYLRTQFTQSILQHYF